MEEKTPLKDSFDRAIDYLRVSITDRCNLRCRYCMPEERVPSVGHGAVLSSEELLRITADGRIRRCLLCSEEFIFKEILRRGASDQQLKELLQAATWDKPKQHQAGEKDYREGKCGMQQIGG